MVVDELDQIRLVQLKQTTVCGCRHVGGAQLRGNRRQFTKDIPNAQIAQVQLVIVHPQRARRYHEETAAHRSFHDHCLPRCNMHLFDFGHKRCHGRVVECLEQGDRLKEHSLFQVTQHTGAGGRFCARLGNGRAKLIERQRVVPVGQVGGFGDHQHLHLSFGDNRGAAFGAAHHPRSTQEQPGFRRKWLVAAQRHDFQPRLQRQIDKRGRRSTLDQDVTRL